MLSNGVGTPTVAERRAELRSRCVVTRAGHGTTRDLAGATKTGAPGLRAGDEPVRTPRAEMRHSVRCPAAALACYEDSSELGAILSGSTDTPTCRASGGGARPARRCSARRTRPTRRRSRPGWASSCTCRPRRQASGEPSPGGASPSHDLLLGICPTVTKRMARAAKARPCSVRSRRVRDMNGNT